MFKQAYNNIFKTKRNWKWIMIGSLVGLGIAFLTFCLAAFIFNTYYTAMGGL